MTHVLVAGALACTILLACSREKPKPDRTEPWLAPALAPSASGVAAVGRVDYTLKSSNIEFELPARRGTPRGRVRDARGTLSVDFSDLTRSRGSLEIDLASLELRADSSTAADAESTARALSWLELGAEVAPDLRETGRFATFKLRGLSSSATPRSAGNRPGGRRSEWSVEGDLSLHGVRAPETVEISLDLGEEPDAQSQEFVIRSRKPLVVSLNTHDIRPRDARGSALPREASLLGDSVGREARVTFELVFARAAAR